MSVELEFLWCRHTPPLKTQKAQTLIPGFSLTDRKTVVCWSNVLKLLS
ncbi:hypothetical protein LEP1GSC079_2368 [Leptospira interrogans str. FPW1039]|uniref:Uncharacterized protein n=1 Tax=Leptospira interrogans str. FPW1039 TaxID=1193040 RepID=A0A0F6IDG9_LEPIR|nr:hypothetical protein LEP1GSC079_2368 [Leptospira interrogans str. FPW1039]